MHCALQRRAVARIELRHDRALLGVGHRGPCADFRERAPATQAVPARSVHHTDLGAGRSDQAALALFAAIALPALEAGSLPMTPQIHCPVSTTLSRSTPVRMPRPCSM